MNAESMNTGGEIRICKAEKKDIPMIIEIMEEAYCHMENQEWFCKDDAEFLERHIDKEGFILKAVISGDIAGFLVVRYPNSAEDNLGSYLELSDEEKQLTAHMESAAVKKEYRGLGIQKKLMKEGEVCLRQQGYEYLMGTAHPDNVYSVNNFLRLGYEIVAEDVKYGGMPRYVFCHKEK